MRTWMIAIVLGLATTAYAADERADAPDPTSAGPQLSANDHWAGVMVIGAIFLFVSAGVIGPIIRMNTPEEVPPAHSHDEPPGASHHHGLSGTKNPEPH